MMNTKESTRSLPKKPQLLDPKASGPSFAVQKYKQHFTYWSHLLSICFIIYRSKYFTSLLLQQEWHFVQKLGVVTAPLLFILVQSIHEDSTIVSLERSAVYFWIATVKSQINRFLYNYIGICLTTVVDLLGRAYGPNLFER